MALKLNASNSLEELAQQLCTELKDQEQHIFQPYYIITQTEGMNNWLKQQLAGTLGIAANYKFLKPAELVYQLYQLFDGPYSSGITPGNFCWLIYQFLDDGDFKDRFPAVAAYYENDANEDVKRIALAEKVADLFDQYQIYRPEVIIQWNQASSEELAGDDWQKYLWIRLKNVTSGIAPDKTILRQYLFDKLRDPYFQELLQGRMPALHLFGISVITEYHTELLSELGKYIDVSFHLLNPAPEIYWFEDRSEKQLITLEKRGLIDRGAQVAGNPLLLNWGRLIQNTFHLLFKDDCFLNAYREIGGNPPDGQTLLSKIQQDIYCNRAGEDRNGIDICDLTDSSLTINSCYTPVREVESFYNFLVYLIGQKGADLSPQDILVMVSDIDAYTPYIKAIFNNAPYRFSYTIADESFASNDSLFASLRMILQIQDHSFKAEAILQLLDSGFIRRRFGIQDLTLIRKVVDRANIRFGMEGNAEDETLYVSWEYGLERIIYGLCFSGEEEVLIGSNSLYPLDIVEGHAAEEIVRFCHFCKVLMSLVRSRRSPRSMAQWVTYIEQVVYNLICEQEEEAGEEMQLILHELEKYNTLENILTGNLTYEVFAHHFLQFLTTSSSTQNFAAGGITFCSLIPMRSIPFKIVAMLGMNFDKFPRKEAPNSFSLLEKEKRRGDRNVKDNDKHLFLETLLSAKEYLYISYTGQNTKDNSTIPPSAVIDELLDYLQAGMADEQEVRNLLVTRQPLHSYSRKYNRGQYGLYNYFHQGGKTGIPGLIKEASGTGFSFDEISLNSFIAFFKNPCKGYYNRVLEIFYELDSVLLSETELFELDSLQQWALKPELLSVESPEVTELRKQMVKTGRLPLKHMADISLRSMEKVVAPVRDLLNSCVAAQVPGIQMIDLNVDGTILKGQINDVYDNLFVFISWSKSESKNLIDAYLRYLILRASGQDIDLKYISASKEKIFTAAPLETEAALEQIRQLIALYNTGHATMIPFYPGILKNSGEISDLTPDLYYQKIGKKINDFNVPLDDPYIISAYNRGAFETAEGFQQFQQAANHLLAPLEEVFQDYYQS